MLIIANAYRRLNLWNANCGASFEWVGRAINPYLGFLTGWLMIVGVRHRHRRRGGGARARRCSPSSGPAPRAPGPNIVIGTAVVLVMLVIAVVGIRITARTQVGMAVVEYAILIGFAIAGLVVVLGHHAGTVPDHQRAGSARQRDRRQGQPVAGFLVAVFIYSGWDGTVYVNEEVKHRRVNPGRAAIIAVALLAIIYTLAQVGLQGVVSPAGCRPHSTTALVYVAAGPRRRQLGQGDGAVHRAVGDRHHRHRHRAHRPDRLRHGQLPGAARVPRPTCPAGSTPRSRPASWSAC